MLRKLGLWLAHAYFSRKTFEKTEVFEKRFLEKTTGKTEVRRKN